MLEKTLESPLDCKEIKPVNPKGNQSWIFFGRTDAEAKIPILWPPDVKNWLTGKDPNAGKDWRQEEKGMTEDETVGWHHWLNGHEFEQAPRAGDGQGSVRAIVHGVTKNWTWLSNWTCLGWKGTELRKTGRGEDITFDLTPKWEEGVVEQISYEGIYGRRNTMEKDLERNS